MGRLVGLLPKGAQDALSAIAAPFIEFGRIVGRIVAGVAMAFESLFNGEFVANMGTIFTAVWEAIKSGAAEAVKNTALGAWDAIKQGVTDTADWIVQKFTGSWDAVKSTAFGVWDAIKQKINDAIDSAKTFFGFGNGGGGGDKDKAPGFASGGHVRGPGSGARDSIIARISNGEYIFTAKAVRRLGIPLLNALNYGLRDIGGAFRGFSMHFWQGWQSDGAPIG